MPDTDQIAVFAFKQAQRVATTRTDTPFFSESLPSNVPVYPTQIYTDFVLIPPTAPSLPPDGIDGSGTVQYKEKLALNAQPYVAGPGNARSYYNLLLVHCIPFNFDPAGSYNYTLYDSDASTIIPFGQGDWVVDTASGVLTFYGTPQPAGSQVFLSFYKYVGATGTTVQGNIPTDANGVTVATDGPNGINPVNKAEASTGDVLYVRKASGLTLLSGPNPPGGLSNVAPFGVVDNGPNYTTLVLKVVTVNASSQVFISFPSNLSNFCSYYYEILAHGTESAGNAVFGKKMDGVCCNAVHFETRTETSTIAGTQLNIAAGATGWDVLVTGMSPFTITWLITVKYSQYRIA